MGSHKKFISIGIVLMAVVIAGLILYGGGLVRQASSPGSPQTVNSTTTPTKPVSAAVGLRPRPAVPSGSQTYQITQAAETWPKILQATVSPPDVHVGDTQKLSVVVQDGVAITSVRAITRTDNGTTTVDLALVGPTPASSLLPQKYFVDGNNKIAFATSGNADLVKNPQFGPTAEAAAPPTYTYAAEWTVKDTHSAKYYTTFTITDSSGKTNSFTMAWLDPCFTQAQQGTNATLTSACALSQVDGLDGGNLTLSTGGNITINSGGTFVFNQGKSITMSGGSIAIAASGAQMTKAFLYYVNQSGNCYAPNGTMSTDATNPGTSASCAGGVSGTALFKPGGYVRVMSARGTNGCYDLNPLVHPGQTAYFTTTRGTAAMGNDSAGHTWNSFDYNCTGVIDYYAVDQGQVSNEVCTPNGDDCDCQTYSYGGFIQYYTATNAPACGTQYYYYDPSCPSPCLHSDNCPAPTFYIATSSCN